MTLDRISYQELFTLGSFANRRLGLEGTLSPGEDPLQAWEEMQKMAHEYQQTHAPADLDEMRGTHVRDIHDMQDTAMKQPTTNEDKIEGWKQVISMCTSIKALERFKMQVDREKNEELTQAYNDKLKQLQDG